MTEEEMTHVHQVGWPISPRVGFSWRSGEVVASVTRLSRITSRARLGGTSCITETAVVDKPAEADEHAGHHHGHAH